MRGPDPMERVGDPVSDIMRKYKFPRERICPHDVMKVEKPVSPNHCSGRQMNSR